MPKNHDALVVQFISRNLVSSSIQDKHYAYTDNAKGKLQFVLQSVITR